jgi:hypothetical protein
MKTTYSRRFGQWQVTVNKNSVSVIGNFFSNYGVVYGLHYDIFNRPRFFGMDSNIGMTGRVIDYVNSCITKLYNA